MEAHSKTITPKQLYLAAGALMLIAFMVLFRMELKTTYLALR